MHKLNDVVFCRLAPSAIHGVGVFAIRDIPEGTYFTGGDAHYTREGMETILPEIMALIQDRYLFVEYPDWWDVLPNPNWDAKLQCFINHSATPNSHGNDKGQYATRDIKAGEEITEDFTVFPRPLGPMALKHFTFLKV